MTKPRLRFNLSGHPAAGFDDSPLVAIDLPTDADQLASAISTVIANLPERNRLLAGETAIVLLPNWSPAAACLLAQWHGQFGAFPIIQWAVRADEGFTYPETALCDLNQLRQIARTRRDE